jgi:DNA-binding response OmpR family regulator
MPEPTPSKLSPSRSTDRLIGRSVLIAGLDSDAQQLVRTALVESGLEVVVTTNVFDALFGDEDHEFMCLVLGGNLEEVCNEVCYLRSLGLKYPTLALLTDPGVRARVVALEIGVDDCLGPQFAVAELVARVHSLNRRPLLMLEREEVTAGDLSLSIEDYTVTLNGNTLILTPTETGILKLLMESRGRIVSTSQITQAVWNGSSDGLRPNLVSVHLSNLRRKLGASLNFDKIVTFRNRGYMLVG